ncbi:hypothetical protein MP228_012625 [Amoeboaphelidium protococcarum]|nr:hypothetical protein MP228_012625 [Amoeboaphelidium protococcarum]
MIRLVLVLLASLQIVFTAPVETSDADDLSGLIESDNADHDLSQDAYVESELDQSLDDMISSIQGTSEETGKLLTLIKLEKSLRQCSAVEDGLGNYQVPRDFSNKDAISEQYQCDYSMNQYLKHYNVLTGSEPIIRQVFDPSYALKQVRRDIDATYAKIHQLTGRTSTLSSYRQALRATKNVQERVSLARRLPHIVNHRSTHAVSPMNRLTRI